MNINSEYGNWNVYQLDKRLFLNALTWPTWWLSWQKIFAGVLQGSVLVPRLVLLNIKDSIFYHQPIEVA